MGLLNIDNWLKTLAMKNFKHLLYKYYPKFFKPFKIHPNKLDIRQFLVLLYSYVPNMKNLWTIDRLSKNVLQVGTGKNLFI